MVSTASSYNDTRYRAAAGLGYDGVVRVSTGTHYGTGSLLFDGLHILTSAHLFASLDDPVVYFQTSGGDFSRTGEIVAIHSDYDAADAANDLALVRLSAPAPLLADRYQLFRDSAVGRDFTLVGYGVGGSGTSGVVDSEANPIRRLARNTFDGAFETMDEVLGHTLTWSPPSGTQIFADFDDGTSLRDAAGLLLGLHDPGLGLMEGMITPGDSGGPAFVDGRIAGVSTYIASLEYNGMAPDSDGILNGTFGEIGFWQRLDAYAEWIDQSLRASWPGAPASPDQVEKTLYEGNSGTAYAFFMVQLSSPGPTGGSVAYQTQNGTATAGEDYFAASGRLVLYPGETEAVIPVEVIGDTRIETDETFFLEIFDPIGGVFPDGQTSLIAMRTIIDDDGAGFSVLTTAALTGIDLQSEPWPLSA